MGDFLADHPPPAKDPPHPPPSLERQNLHSRELFINSHNRTPDIENRTIFHRQYRPSIADIGKLELQKKF